MNVFFTSLSGTLRALLRWSIAGFCLIAMYHGQATAHAEPSSESDDYIIISDESDVAPTDQPEVTEPTDSSDEPTEMPTEDDSAVGDAESEDASGEATEAPNATPTTAKLAAEDIAPIGQPAPDVPAATSPASGEPEEMGDAEHVGPAKPAAQATPSDLADAKETAEHAKPQAASRLAVEGASFRGVLPSETTEEELKSTWGPAKEVREAETGHQHIYYIKPFKQVLVTVIHGKVDTILIRLDKEVEPKALARQLMLDDVEPATIFNSKGQMLGMAFPERGVLFGFASGVPVHVAQIVLEPINSQPFVTRAEKNYRRKPADALADAEYAIEIDPEYDRAHAIKARTLLELGELEKALAAADKALALLPDHAEHQLTRARILFQLQHYDEASPIVDALSADAEAPLLVRARAEQMRGDVLSKGPERKFDVAIKHHTEAISRAEKVSTSSAGPVRRAAKELLVEAHVAVAHDIAWGNWQQKAKVASRWIERATSFCDNLIEKDFGEECVRLRLFEQTLNAYAGMKDAPDVTATVDATTKLARKLIGETQDSRQTELRQWQLGEALSSAMAICQQQAKVDAATQLGQQALACFEKAGTFREACPESAFLVGKVFFRLGAIEAVDRSEHAKAAVWYDEAIPLLERPLPPCARPESGRTGEMFVSMAVTYWEVAKRKEAIRLTQQGASLMDVAIKQYGFPSEALSVPYSNLASMHAGVGNNVESKRCAKMAAKAETLRR